MTPPRDPLRLLRLGGRIEPYPAEPSDDEVAATAGVPRAAVIRFDLNTLGGGPLPGVTAALAAYDAARLVEYGDQGLRELRAAIGHAIGVDPRRIVPGAGADELIRLLTTSVVEPGATVLVPTPTFAMYEVEARLAGGSVVAVGREAPAERQPVHLLAGRAKESGARLVWVCSPNNPTADRYELDEIRQLASAVDALVVVDAVYQEFAEASEGLDAEALSLTVLQDELPNVIILRSLAKAYGLAGARVGYVVAAGPVADHLHAARLPLPIGGASEAAALGALADPGLARMRQREIVAERGRLADRLVDAGWHVLPSVTNFVLARPPAGTAAARVADRLLERGLVVRAYPEGLLRDWVRITARTEHDDDRLLAAIAEIGDLPRN